MGSEYMVGYSSVIVSGLAVMREQPGQSTSTRYRHYGRVNSPLPRTGILTVGCEIVSMSQPLRLLRVGRSFRIVLADCRVSMTPEARLTNLSY